jgi:hypothetical protein
VIANIVAAIGLLRGAARLRQMPPQAMPLFAGLAMVLFARFIPLLYYFAAVTLLAGCLVALLGRTPSRSAAAARAARLVTLATSGATAVQVVLAFAAAAAAHWEVFGQAFAATALILLTLSAIWLLVTTLKSGAAWNPRLAGTLALVAVAACAIAVARWDQRTPWTRYVESGAAARDLSGVIPDRASVYWDGGIEMMWLGLGRPSFFSCTQGVGVVFSRGTAMAYLNRRASLFPLKERDFEECVEPDDGRQLNPRPADLANACAKEPDLDYVVLGRAFPGVASREWDAPVPLTVERPADPGGKQISTRRFFIYSCATIRSFGPVRG